MAWKFVDMERDPRREQFAYFRDFANPYLGVTAEVDVTEVLDWTRRTGTSFFLAVLYASVRAANAVPELRRRLRGGAVVEYDQCPSSHTVALPDGSYLYRRGGKTLLLGEAYRICDGVMEQVSENGRKLTLSKG